MTDSNSPIIARGAAFAYFYRRLGKWQWRGVLGSIVATVGGFVGMMYQRFGGAADVDSGVCFKAMTIGLAFLIAFVLFFWVRAALKKAAMIVALLMAAVAAFSYFSGINVDASSVKEGYDSASGWIWTQCRAVLAMVTNNLGGAASAGAGAWMGMSRGK